MHNRTRFFLPLGVCTFCLISATGVAMSSFSTGNAPVENKGWPTGTFSVRGIPKGHYVIHAEAEGHVGRNTGWYNNRNGHSYHEMDILLARAGFLRGKVVDTRGSPVPGVTVRAKGTWGIDGLSYTCSRKPTATTDNDGRFELISLPRGLTSLRCTTPSLHVRSITPELLIVGMLAWEKPEEAIIVVEGTGTVHGKVVDGAGFPPRFMNNPGQRRADSIEFLCSRYGIDGERLTLCFDTSPWKKPSVLRATR